MYTDHARHRPDAEPMDCSAVTKTSDQTNSDLTEVKDLLKVLVMKDFQVQPQQSPKTAPQVQPPSQQRQYQQQNHYQTPPPQHYRPPPQHTRPYFHTQPPPQTSYRSGPTRGYPPEQRPQPLMSDFRLQPYRWTPDKRPICAFCGKVGHKYRVCRKLASMTPGYGNLQASEQKQGN